MKYTVYRIRRQDTGQFYSGGQYGYWAPDGASGATYETKAACKCVWSMGRRSWMRYRPLPDGVKAEIVEYSVVESPGTIEVLT